MSKIDELDHDVVIRANDHGGEDKDGQQGGQHGIEHQAGEHEVEHGIEHLFREKLEHQPGKEHDFFSIHAAGKFIIPDFNELHDLIIFKAETGVHNMEDLLAGISEIRDTLEGVKVSFHDDNESSITLVGLKQDDLSTDMVGFSDTGF